MSKKITVSVLALLLVCTSLFAGCSKKGEYVNPATGDEYELVTDAEGNKVLSDDGELLVYAKDENGEYVTDANGEKVTQVQGFIGQLEENGVVEDYAYIVKMPEGWTFNGNGEFVNKSKKYKAVVSIQQRTYDSYYSINEYFYAELSKKYDKSFWEEKHLDFADADGVFLGVDFNGEKALDVFFVNNGNVYNISMSTGNSEFDFAAFDEFVNSITFKPYSYYQESELKDGSLFGTDNFVETTDDATSTSAVQ